MGEFSLLNTFFKSLLGFCSVKQLSGDIIMKQYTDVIERYQGIFTPGILFLIYRPLAWIDDLNVRVSQESEHELALIYNWLILMLIYKCANPAEIGAWVLACSPAHMLHGN